MVRNYIKNALKEIGICLLWYSWLTCNELNSVFMTSGSGLYFGVFKNVFGDLSGGDFSQFCLTPCCSPPGCKSVSFYFLLFPLAASGLTFSLVELVCIKFQIFDNLISD